MSSIQPFSDDGESELVNMIFPAMGDVKFSDRIWCSTSLTLRNKANKVYRRCFLGPSDEEKVVLDGFSAYVTVTRKSEGTKLQF
ncbi:hypothetical protein F442_07598 [Phytophthora nicotianae P10297]|uniref:Uncharacterized protein n=1 Tax=Phytophthora nicotianae P10297 TaxID=1317064 RepID=W2ZFN2_PHYNI|nr:hypothetical protein F442_07598 [Phytophthora nicotianae P10297]